MCIEGDFIISSLFRDFLILHDGKQDIAGILTYIGVYLLRKANLGGLGYIISNSCRLANLYVT